MNKHNAHAFLPPFCPFCGEERACYGQCDEAREFREVLPASTEGEG